MLYPLLGSHQVYLLDLNLESQMFLNIIKILKFSLLLPNQGFYANIQQMN